MSDMLEEMLDKLRHYPGEYTEAESKAYSSLFEKVNDEAKKRGFWWAR